MLQWQGEPLFPPHPRPQVPAPSFFITTTMAFVILIFFPT